MGTIRTTTSPADKRQQILDAAYVVFSRKGYHRATVDEIIKLADTGKGTVYNYFASKEQLFYTLISERSQPFERALAQVAASDTPPLEKISLLIKLFLQFYVENGDLWRVLMHEMRGFGVEGYSKLLPEQVDKYREGFRRTIAFLEQTLADGIRQGVIRQCDAVKSAYGLFSAIITMVFQNYVGNDIDGTAKAIADIFLYGVARK